MHGCDQDYIAINLTVHCKFFQGDGGPGTERHRQVQATENQRSERRVHQLLPSADRTLQKGIVNKLH